ncbi:MAG: nucleoside hydrolase [Chloroflexi bacterium]|nr:nucleoside hydrolase [Chloroflexota bacterium]
MGTGRRRVILDTDVGGDIDDAFAIALLALSPEIELVGMTTEHGDTRRRAAIARKLLRLLGRGNVPVVAGRQQPLEPGQPAFWGGSEGEGFVTTADVAAEPVGDAVAFLREALRASPEPLTLITIGPMTNVGALVQQAPDLVTKIKTLVVMGGILDAGAVPVHHEWNLNSDPLAAELALNCGAPLVVGVQDVVKSPTIGPTERQRLLDAGGPAHRGIVAMLDRWLAVVQRAWTSMYDPATAAWTLGWPYLKLEPRRLRTVLGPDPVERRVSFPTWPTLRPPPGGVVRQRLVRTVFEPPDPAGDGVQALVSVAHDDAGFIAAMIDRICSGRRDVRSE